MARIGISKGTMVVVRYNPLMSATNVAALKYADTVHRVSKVVETPRRDSTRSVLRTGRCNREERGSVCVHS